MSKFDGTNSIGPVFLDLKIESGLPKMSKLSGLLGFFIIVSKSSKKNLFKCFIVLFIIFYLVFDIFSN
jgi:hypothetical protein